MERLLRVAPPALTKRLDETPAWQCPRPHHRPDATPNAGTPHGGHLMGTRQRGDTRACCPRREKMAPAPSSRFPSPCRPLFALFLFPPSMPRDGSWLTRGPSSRRAPRRCGSPAPAPLGAAEGRGGDGAAAVTWRGSRRWAAASPPPARRRGSRSWSSPPCRAAGRPPGPAAVCLSVCLSADRRAPGRAGSGHVGPACRAGRAGWGGAAGGGRARRLRGWGEGRPGRGTHTAAAGTFPSARSPGSPGKGRGRHAALLALAGLREGGRPPERGEGRRARPPLGTPPPPVPQRGLRRPLIPPPPVSAARGGWGVGGASQRVEVRVQNWPGSACLAPWEPREGGSCRVVIAKSKEMVSRKDPPWNLEVIFLSVLG